jgi:hypothetical protein
MRSRRTSTRESFKSRENFLGLNPSEVAAKFVIKPRIIEQI